MTLLWGEYPWYPVYLATTVVNVGLDTRAYSMKGLVVEEGGSDAQVVVMHVQEARKWRCDLGAAFTHPFIPPPPRRNREISDMINSNEL